MKIQRLHKQKEAPHNSEDTPYGAGYGVRTRDIQLGKLTLYQLS